MVLHCPSTEVGIKLLRWIGNELHMAFSQTNLSPLKANVSLNKLNYLSGRASRIQRPEVHGQ